MTGTESGRGLDRNCWIIQTGVNQVKFQVLQSMKEQKAQNGSRIKILPPADVLDTLAAMPEVNAVILDPWYNKGVGGERDDYNEWLSNVIRAACRISQHVFVWGFPEILAFQIANIPKAFSLVSWLTWYYKNCPSVIRGWRSAQNTCLHLSLRNAPTYPEHFLSEEQLSRWKAGKMRFIPGPPSVLEAPLNIGFIGRNEQTGHPAQKPLSVIEPLLLMSTKSTIPFSIPCADQELPGRRAAVSIGMRSCATVPRILCP